MSTARDTLELHDAEGALERIEAWLRERGFFANPLHELHHLNATLFRAARIIVDTSLHLGEMTFDEAVEVIMRSWTSRTRLDNLGISFPSWSSKLQSFKKMRLEALPQKIGFPRLPEIFTKFTKNQFRW